MKEKMLEQKGKWLITYNNKKWNGKRYVLDKMVLDLDNMLFDDYEWYKLDEMQGEADINKIDDYLRDAKSIKKIKS
jgi:hypothetical protein